MLQRENEKRLHNEGYLLVAGIDEAGRGPLAGPVVAAGAIILDDRGLEEIRDSKKLTSKQREAMFDELKKSDRIVFATGVVSHTRIDEINILQATFEAMKLAVDGLKIKPDFLLVDGHLSPRMKIPDLPIVKGDTVELSIALASIIAKVTRDRIMREIDQKYPGYGFKSHMGYGTKAHLVALHQLGPSPIHRRSFAPVKERLLI
ncbi:MAG: ribonuclease HII [Simkaniaceae bacterium]|nr:ribonuclease HII [Simkaniaceae bacterium]MCF7852954.1 ribonuclease HII [Simkaniaceae bacterium]